MLQTTGDRRLEICILRPDAIDVIELDGNARRFHVDFRSPGLEGRSKGLVPSQLSQAHLATRPNRLKVRHN